MQLGAWFGQQSYPLASRPWPQFWRARGMFWLYVGFVTYFWSWTFDDGFVLEVNDCSEVLAAVPMQRGTCGLLVAG